jgi:hypothetical protein
MHLPVSYINPPDCRRVIVNIILYYYLIDLIFFAQVILSNSGELFAYYIGEDADTNMHNVYLLKYGSM